MKKYCSSEIVSALKEARIENGDIVLVHSALFALGSFESAGGPDSGVTGIVQTMIDHLGPKGTLVVPAFNFDFCKGAPFNRGQTPSQNMGVLSEAIRIWPGAMRSRHPMQSVAAIGLLAKEICEPDKGSSFAPGGPFDIMLYENTKFLFFGASIQAASPIHLTEERLQVPYRYWKDFSGQYIDGAIDEVRRYQMFVRRLEWAPELDITILGDVMVERKQLLHVPLGMGRILSCSFRDFYETSSERVGKDPFFLLKNRDVVMSKAQQH